MSISFHILNASRRLEKFQPQLSESLQRGLELTLQKLSLPVVDVVIADDPQSAIEETGMG